MSETETTLEEVLEAIRKEAPEFAAEHGSVEVIVPMCSPIAKAGIRNVNGIKIDHDDWTWLNHKTGERTKPGPESVQFHTDDHPMWGSKAVEEDDDWLDDMDDDDE